MTYSRVKKYHNKKNKKIKKGFATALMSSVLVAPFVLSTTQVVNADNVEKGNQVTTWKANTVSTIKDQMKNQGLDLAHVSGKYVVRQGDTLSEIALAANESMEKIASDNNIKNVDLIYIGQVLYLNTDGQGNVSLSSTGVATNNPVVSNEAVTIMNGNKVTGTGTTIAQASHTKEQMQATSMINAGVKPNVNASNSISGTTSSTTQSSNSHAANSSSATQSSSSSSANSSSTTQSSSSHASNSSSTTQSSSSHAANSSSTTQSGSSHAASSSSTTQSSSSHAASSSSTTQSSSSHAASSSSTTQSSSSHASNSSSTTQSSSSHAANSSSTTQSSSSHASNSSSTTQSSSSSSANSSSTTQSSSSHASNSSSTTQSSSSSSANSSSTSQSNSSSSSSSIDYEKGVVNSDGTTNYDAAINQKGPWNGKSQEQGTASDSFYDTAAQEQWQKDHPNADTIGETYSDGSTSQVPNYAGDDSLYKNNERPQMTQEQLDETNKSMQNKIDPSKTFGNGIQWVSSDYQGEVVGSQTITVDNPVNTPYEDYTEHTAQIDANVVKQAYSGTNPYGVTATTPDGAHYVSSTITNAGQTGGPDGLSANNVNLTFYK